MKERIISVEISVVDEDGIALPEFETNFCYMAAPDDWESDQIKDEVESLTDFIARGMEAS